MVIPWIEPNVVVRQNTLATQPRSRHETLKASDNGAVQHDRAVARTILSHIFSIQALWHGKVHLDGATLPMTPNRIF